MDNRFQKKAYKQKLKLVRIFNFKEIDEKIARVIILVLRDTLENQFWRPKQIYRLKFIY